MDHATRLARRSDLVSRPCLSGVEAILSETQVKRGLRVVHGDKELREKLGRNDLCPCGSGRLFKRCCRNSGFFSTGLKETTTSDSGDILVCPESRRIVHCLGPFFRGLKRPGVS